jgi:general secretion pathway protein E
MHTPTIKIVTIEDPIEYHLEGIVQTQTNGKDYTFASGLRSVLRQDPNIIMVGEIRDAEVAETAVQAALTGHFVFSTLHTNNAAGTFPRLVDLGVDPKLFASAVTVAMAQRLVRTLDDTTKRARPATAEEKAMMGNVLSTLTDKSLIPASLDTVYDAVPDEASGSSGYKGRTGVHEAIFMDDELGEFLRSNPSEGDIAKNSLRQGYPTMAQDAVIKALAGKTTLEEIVRDLAKRPEAVFRDDVLVKCGELFYKKNARFWRAFFVFKSHSQPSRHSLCKHRVDETPEVLPSTPRKRGTRKSLGRRPKPSDLA